MQADNIVPDPKNALAWNPYMYVLGDPIGNNDPTGHAGAGAAVAGAMTRKALQEGKVSQTTVDLAQLLPYWIIGGVVGAELATPYVVTAAPTLLPMANNALEAAETGGAAGAVGAVGVGVGLRVATPVVARVLSQEADDIGNAAGQLADGVVVKPLQATARQLGPIGRGGPGAFIRAVSEAEAAALKRTGAIRQLEALEARLRANGAPAEEIQKVVAQRVAMKANMYEAKLPPRPFEERIHRVRLDRPPPPPSGPPSAPQGLDTLVE